MKLLHSTQTNTQTQLHTSERVAHPLSAPIGHLEHTDRPRSRQWSLPSGTTDLSVGLNQFICHIFVI